MSETQKRNSCHVMEELLTACKILDQEGLVKGFGHVRPEILELEEGSSSLLERLCV